MNIQSIRYFSIIAELENMSRAAELLHTSQSSLSKAVFSLENELGIALFDRNGKKLILNDAGMRFLESCRLILNEVDEVSKDLSIYYSGSDNGIRICTAGIVKDFYKCLADFKKKYSNVEYIINTLEEDVIPDINYYDIVIYPNERRFEKFKGYDFCDEKYYFAVNCNDDLNKRASIPVSEMDGKDYVFLKEKNNYAYTYRMCSALRVNMRTVSFVDSKSAHRSMIANGIAAGFVSAVDADLYRSDNRIRLIPLTDDRFVRHFKICFKREKHLSVIAVAFKDHLMQYFDINE